MEKWPWWNNKYWHYLDLNRLDKNWKFKWKCLQFNFNEIEFIFYLNIQDLFWVLMTYLCTLNAGFFLTGGSVWLNWLVAADTYILIDGVGFYGKKLTILNILQIQNNSLKNY